MKLCTIGVYGFDEHTFYDRLQESEVDLLIDIRRRRGVRGAKYAFANSRRLQDGLLSRGVGYIHEIDLAPSRELIQKQDERDKAKLGSRRRRTTLPSDFRDAYTRECLIDFDFHGFMNSHRLKGKTVAFLCVESDPNGCHRSMVADHFRSLVSSQIEHLRP